MLIFSFSLPATKLAVADLDPWVVAFGRAVVAAAVGAIVLRVTRAPLPNRSQVRRLLIVAGGVVVGFPLMTTLALQTAASAHGAVVVALLPAATAAFAVLRAGERPGPVFWVAALAGLAVVLAFSLARTGGALTLADVELLIAIAACALGYAEGGVLARELGGARTICWALVLFAPVSVAITAVALARARLPRRPGRAARLRLRERDLDVPRLLRLVRRARARSASPAPASSSSPSRCSRSAGRRSCSASTSAPGTLLAAVAVLASVVVTQRARITVARAPARTGLPPAARGPTPPLAPAAPAPHGAGGP